MSSDDALAGAAILIGALVPTLLTVAYLSEPRSSREEAPRYEVIERSSPRGYVDHAIIRDIELMVGPEGPHSGWQGRGDVDSSTPRMR